MEDGETPRMHKYVENKTTRIMTATVRHVTSGSGLRKFQADGFLFDWVYQLNSVHAFGSAMEVREGYLKITTGQIITSLLRHPM